MTYYQMPIKVRNGIGVIARITVLLRKYEVDIHELTTEHIDPRFSYVKIIVKKPKTPIDIICKKLERLVPVVEASYKEVSI